MPSVVSSRVYTYIKLPAGTLSKPTPQERPTWNETNKKKNRTHSKSSRSSNPLVQWFIRISNSIARTHHRIGLIAIFVFFGQTNFMQISVSLLRIQKFHRCSSNIFVSKRSFFWNTYIQVFPRVNTSPPTLDAIKYSLYVFLLDPCRR